MDTRQLEIFAAVAEERSFTRAAQRLFAAQSTVSAAVRALEAELGTTLLERSTRSVELSPVGEAVLAHARSALEAVELMRLAAGDDAGGLRGRVRIGFFTSLDAIDLPGLFGAFHREHPLVNLRLVASPSGSTGLLEDLRRGRLDVALAGLPAADLAGLETVPLGQADFVALLPLGHRLAARANVTLADLAAEPFVDTPTGFGNRVVADRAFEAAGLPRTVVAEVADLSAVPRYVSAGLGVAVVPRIRWLWDERTVAVPLTPRLPWNLSAVHLPQAGRSPAVAAVLELLAARADGLVLTEPGADAGAQTPTPR